MAAVRTSRWRRGGERRPGRTEARVRRNEECARDREDYGTRNAPGNEARGGAGPQPPPTGDMRRSGDGGDPKGPRAGVDAADGGHTGEARDGDEASQALPFPGDHET